MLLAELEGPEKWRKKWKERKVGSENSVYPYQVTPSPSPK